MQNRKRMEARLRKQARELGLQVVALYLKKSPGGESKLSR